MDPESNNQIWTPEGGNRIDSGGAIIKEIIEENLLSWGKILNLRFQFNPQI